MTTMFTFSIDNAVNPYINEHGRYREQKNITFKAYAENPVTKFQEFLKHVEPGDYITITATVETTPLLNTHTDVPLHYPVSIAAKMLTGEARKIDGATVVVWSETEYYSIDGSVKN